jgi:hypothetical protein
MCMGQKGIIVIVIVIVILAFAFVPQWPSRRYEFLRIGVGKARPNVLDGQKMCDLPFANPRRAIKTEP